MSDYAIALISIGVFILGVIISGVIQYFMNPDPDADDDTTG
ncbi:hypothetical protein [Noviherbaspirillum denitrificans]|nr:hypothetical protein [Noviherbaspirillum denitrificans]